MWKDLKRLISSKDKLNLINLFILLLVATIIEMIGIGSVPIFAILITNPESISEYIPKIFDLNFIVKLESKKIALYGAICLLIIFSIKNLFLGGVSYFQAKTIENLRVSIHNKLFKIYIYSNYEFHLTKNPSELIRNVTSEIGRATNYILNFIMLVKEILVMVAIFVLLISVDFKISLLTFSLLGLFSLIFYLLSKGGAKKRGEIAQRFWGAIIKAVNQGLGSVKETKILNKEDYICRVFDENLRIVEKYNFWQNFILVLPKLFLEVIAISTILVVSVLFVFLDRNPENFIPLITLITVAMARLMPSFNTITSSVARLKYLLPAFELIIKELSEGEHFEYKENIQDSSDQKKKVNEFKNSLEVKNLTYYYPNTNKKVINDISFKIQCGEVIGIIGTSGAGKSTLTDLMVGLLIPSSGKILVDDQEINLSRKAWQKQIGYIPQDIYLLDDSIKSNIAFGVDNKYFNQKDFDDAVRIAELKEFIHNLPEKENTIVGDRGVKISGGQKQRIGIARSLYFKPKILIFDEPTSALDIENEEKIMKHLYSLEGKFTVIIISHRYSVFSGCNKIIKIENGKLKAIVKYDDFKNENL